jgi:hypothetical protein
VNVSAGTNRAKRRAIRPATKIARFDGSTVFFGFIVPFFVGVAPPPNAATFRLKRSIVA